MPVAQGKILDLRNLLAEKFPQTPFHLKTGFVTGESLLDQIAGNGLPKGAITEITSPHPSAGSASLIARLIRAAARGRYFVVLIDGRDSFDPGPFEKSSLRHLLWVRCQKAADAIKATDLLLRDGNFPAVLLDLALNSPNELNKIPANNWYRLQRLVEPTSTAFLVFCRRSMVASAHLKIVLQNKWTLAALNHESELKPEYLRVQRSHLGTALLSRTGSGA